MRNYLNKLKKHMQVKETNNANRFYGKKTSRKPLYHFLIIGKRQKCEAENCSVYTESYCSLCKISLCKEHRKNHA